MPDSDDIDSCPVIVNPVALKPHVLPTIQITLSSESQISCDENVQPFWLFRRVSSTLPSIPLSGGCKQLKSSIRCRSKISLAAILLIMIMFILDVITLRFSLKQITKYERWENLLKSIEFQLDYFGRILLSEEDQKIISTQFESILVFDNGTRLSTIDKQVLENELSFLTKHKTTLLMVIVVTFIGLGVHFIGFIGVLWKSFTLTLFETLFLFLLLILKPSLWLNDLIWIIWIIYVTCLPLFLIYQIQLYYVKIKR